MVSTISKVSVPLRGSGLMNLNDIRQQERVKVSVPLRGSGLMNMSLQLIAPALSLVSVPLRGSGLMNLQKLLMLFFIRTRFRPLAG